MVLLTTIPWRVIGVVMVLGFVLFVFYRSWLITKKGKTIQEYKKHQENVQLWRKLYYASFIAFVGVLVVVNEVTFMDWQSVLIGIISIVFVDLAVFTTPMITKIWNAELKENEYVKNYLMQNEDVAENYINKVDFFSKIVQQTLLLQMDIKTKELSEYQELELFLSYYPEHFELEMAVYPYYSSDDGDKVKMSGDIVKLLHKLKDVYTLHYESADQIQPIDDDNKRPPIELVAEVLSQGQIVSLVKSGINIQIVPVLNDNRLHSLVYLEEGNGTLQEIDSQLISNLASIYFLTR